MMTTGEGQAARLLAHINAIAREDPTLEGRLPLAYESLGEQCRDGVILCKIINILAPGTIPTRSIQEGTSDPRRGMFRMLENQAEVLKAARRLHCSIVSISSSDLVEGKGNLISGLLWQIVKNGILIKAEGALPSLAPARSRIDMEESAFAENSLLRWVNQSLDRPEGERLANFSKGLSNGIIYAQLLEAVFPSLATDLASKVLQIESSKERATLICKAGQKILGNRCILIPEDITGGNESMNILFLASLCRKAADDMASGSHATTPAAPPCPPLEEYGSLKAKIRELEAEKAMLLSSADPSKDGGCRNESPSAPEQRSVAINSVEMEEFPFSGEQSETDTVEIVDEGGPLTTAGPEHAMEAPCVGLQPALNLFLKKWQATNAGDTQNAVQHLEATLRSGPSPAKPKASEEVTTDEEEIPCARILTTTEEEELWRSSKEAIAFREETRRTLAIYAQDSSRLRQIYHYTKTLIPLLKVIYCCNLGFDQLLSASCYQQGIILKKSVRGGSWNRRRALIRDNFVFFYAEDNNSKPTSVEKLDDALVTYSQGFVSKIKDPVLCVEICSAVNAHHLYLSADEDTLEQWKAAIIRTSNWWAKRER